MSKIPIKRMRYSQLEGFWNSPFPQFRVPNTHPPIQRGCSGIRRKVSCGLWPCELPAWSVSRYIHQKKTVWQEDLHTESEISSFSRRFFFWISPQALSHTNKTDFSRGMTLTAFPLFTARQWNGLASMTRQQHWLIFLRQFSLGCYDALPQSATQWFGVVVFPKPKSCPTIEICISAKT